MASRTHEIADLLRRAFSEEAAFAARSLYLARRADIDGDIALAAQLRAIADSDLSHAFANLELLEDTGEGAPDTVSGQVTALVADKKKVAGSLYSDAAATARRLGMPDMADWFVTAQAAEKLQVSQMTRMGGGRKHG